MKTSEKGIDLIIDFEGLKTKAYKCPAGILTIGVGHTNMAGGFKFVEGCVITKEKAIAILKEDLEKFENMVNRHYFDFPLNQNQFDALVSLAFNCGEGAISGNLKRLIKNCSANVEIRDWWEKHYVTAGGKKLSGLARRRKKEADLFSL